MNNPIIPESRQRRTPGISGLFKFLLKRTQAARNGRAAEKPRKNERKEPLHAGCRRKRARSRQAWDQELGYQGVRWKPALLESEGSGCFAGSRVLPAASLGTQERCHRGSAGDTGPSSRTETRPAFPAEQESTWRGHQREALGTARAMLRAAPLKDNVIWAQ